MVREMRLLVPLENENRWTDLLAVLIATDPVAAARPLRLGNITGRQITVAREVRSELGDRVDLESSWSGSASSSNRTWTRRSS